MPITAEEVRAMARLARLAIDEQDIPAYREQLSRILDFVAQLQAVDTRGVEPLAHPSDVGARLREDAVSETDQRELLQRGAPRTERGLYIVPRVIE